MPARAEHYIEGVKSGKIIVGKTIKQAINRHLSDLRRAKKKDFPYYFDKAIAEKVIQAFELQRLAFGDMADQPFVLMPWQACILYMAYGWRRKDNSQRRFVKCYIKVARGNAKTEFLAGVGNIGFFFENVRDPQIFWVATKKDQAKIGFQRQKTMAESLFRDFDEIREMAATSVSRIYERAGAGYVTYLGKDSNREDGFSPLYGLIDEYHAHPNDGMVHVIESGMIKRASPFTWIITTAGTNPVGPCAEFEKRAKQMLAGDIVNDQLLAFIFDLDDGDDWQDEKNWCKANPSLGISVNLDTLRGEYQKAITEGIAKEANFKTKNLNIWVQSSKGFISDEKFKRAGKPFDPAILDGKLCFGGLDLSKSRDLTALALFFPAQEDGEKHHVLLKFWCPEDNARERARIDGVPYLQWAADGHINLTPGDIIDYGYIQNEFLQCVRKYQFHSCAFDRWRQDEIVVDLNEELGPQMTKTKQFLEGFAQTPGNFTTPITELEKMVMRRTINHGRNPVLEWMNRNVVVKFDHNDNVKFDKQKSKDKIDGMVALAMAIGQWLDYKHEVSEIYSPNLDIVVI